MDFLTDENIATSVVKFLRSKGHDIKDVKENKLFGSDDFKLLEIATKENRVIVTHDKDFANIVRSRDIKHKGIIIIRLFNQTPSNVKDKLENLFIEVPENKIIKNITILREDRIEVYS